MIAGCEQAFFLHVPKTAGESFAALLREVAGRSQVLRLPPDQGFFGALVEADRYPVVHGHAAYPVTGALRQPLALMTLLRSPVERVVSSYEYTRRSDHPMHHALRAKWVERGIETIADLIDTGRASNAQTVLLGAEYDISPLVEDFASGRRTGAEARQEMHRQSRGQANPESLERAMRRLEQFQFVGLTEAFDASVALFAKLIGLDSIPQAPRTNAAPESQRAARTELYDEETLARIAAANALDLELYEFAVELFERRCEAALGEPPAIGAAAISAAAAESPETTPKPRRRRRGSGKAKRGRGRAQGRRRRQRWGTLGEFEQAFFLHIPKTAGRSFGRLLRRGTALGDVLRLDGENIFPGLAVADDYAVIQGHVPFAVAGVLRQPLLMITFLRQPVDRAISLYEYGLRRTDRPLYTRLAHAGIETPVDLVARGISCNRQTKLLGNDHELAPLLERFKANDLDPNEARRALQRLNEDPHPEMLERAKARLEQFQFVGLTEAFDDSVALFAKLIGMRSTPTPERINTAPSSDRAARRLRYDQATLAAVEEANQLDVELYEFASELFHRRYEETFGKRADAVAAD